MTAFGSSREKNEKDHLYIFRFINHSVFDRRICVPIFYKKKTGDAPVGELSEYADPEEPCL